MELSFVALDMDGTSLTPDKLFSDKTKLVLRQLEEETEARIAFCSGRAPEHMFPLIKEIGLANDVPVVACNGALGFMLRGSETPRKLFAKSLTAASAKRVLAFAKERNVMVQYYTENTIFACPCNEVHRKLMKQYSDLTGAQHSLCSEDYREAVAEDPRPFKMLLMTKTPNELFKELQGAFSDLHLIFASTFSKFCPKTSTRALERQSSSLTTFSPRFRSPKSLLLAMASMT